MQGFVRGVTVSPDGTKAFSCGDDKARFFAEKGENSDSFSPLAPHFSMHDVSAGCQNVAYSSESLWDFGGATGLVSARTLRATVLCFIPDGRLASFCLNITHGEKAYKGQWFQGLRQFPSFSRHTYLEHFMHATSVMPGFVSHGLHSWSLDLGRVRPFCWPWKNESCRPLITIGRSPCSWQLVILHLGMPWQLLGTSWWNLTFCLRVRLFRIHVCVSWYLKFRQTFEQVDVWDYNRSAPLSSFEWGCERVITVWGLGFLRWLLPDPAAKSAKSRFNPAESALLASTAVDRSVGLYAEAWDVMLEDGSEQQAGSHVKFADIRICVEILRFERLGCL